MLRNDGGDRHNAPIRHDLTAAEKERLLELHWERAMEKKRQEAADQALLLRAAQVLSGRGR